MGQRLPCNGRCAQQGACIATHLFHICVDSLSFHLVCVQRYWIKDIDTGTVYVIEGEDGGAAQGSAAAAAGGAAGEGRVTELLSGRELRWVLVPIEHLHCMFGGTGLTELLLSGREQLRWATDRQRK